MSKFKDSDLVYCPQLSTDLYILSFEDGRLKASNTRDNGVHRYINSDGKASEYDTMPTAIHATDHSRLALNAAYGMEFEENSALHRALLTGDVVCYVSEDNPSPSEGDPIATISRYVGNSYRTTNGTPWKYAKEISSMKTFNAGDYVYCPSATNDLCIIEREANDLHVVNVRSGASYRYINSNGMLAKIDTMPYVVEATEENRTALSAIYGMEFAENNKLHRLLHTHRVICYVSDTNPKPNHTDPIVTIEKQGKGGYKSSGGMTWRYATGIAIVGTTI